MKKSSILATLVLGLAVSATAGEFKVVNFDNMNFSVKDFLNSDEVKKAEVPAPAASVKPVAGKNWTIMVFVNAKNNLEEFGILDVNEMEMIGSNENLNVVVELARMANYSNADGGWKGVRRYLVQKDNDTTKITSPIVQEFPKADMGDYKHLVEFAKWTKTNYPAKNYMLIIWNHGAGWEKSLNTEGTKGISYDDETNNHITTEQMGLALKEMGGVNVIGTDACLMQMAEIDYRIKDDVDYIVASEETEPGDGYTYNLFLEKVVAKPNPTPKEVGAAAVNGYADHYQQIGQGATQSLVDSSQMVTLKNLVDTFAKAMMASNEKAAIKKAAQGTQSFAYRDNKDLHHFASLVASSCKDQNVVKAAKDVMEHITNKLVLVNRTSGRYTANTKGIAIYIPTYSYKNLYDTMTWAKDTSWDEFVKWMIAK